MNLYINFLYLISSVLFIFGLKLLTSPKTAKRGNFLSAIGMFIAIIITLLNKEIISYTWIITGIIIGTIIGIFFAKKIKMTAMPQMVALLNGFGGIASFFVGFGIYKFNPNIILLTSITIYLSIVIGAVTFTGSLVAFSKLSEKIKILTRPFLFKGQKIINILILLALILFGFFFVLNPIKGHSFILIIAALSLLLGIMVIIPIGAADMPVVISLLNSYSGIATCSTGFVIENNVLIVSGALVGASGIILTIIMCKAMNRSLSNILFSKFSKKIIQKDFITKKAKHCTPQDAYYVLEAAKLIVIVPGYGLAVAQAQHAVAELGEFLEKNGAEVKYAIHPVAGRMPGHMNVLLAEADIDYSKFIEMEDINRIISKVDVCLVIGANDVVNLSARDDKTSIIYGMPIIEVDKAKNIFVLKRSMSPGFAGIQNPLFFKDNTTMIFGDAKNTLNSIIQEF